MFDCERRSHMTVKRMLSALLCVYCAVTALHAQSTTATIQGLVMDQQKAVVPGVTVTAKHIETNATRVVVSDDDGRYRISSLPIGTYEVTAEIAGFSRYVQSGITLSL